MSDKQLTGTITLPGVDPELYELTGEFRPPHEEWCVSVCGKAIRRTDGQPRIILRRKPRKIRVTPTQADLDAATEPIPCWVLNKAANRWLERKLYAIDKFNGWFYTGADVPYSICEIEKEATE